MPVVVHAGPEGMTSPLRLIEGRILGTYPHALSADHAAIAELSALLIEWTAAIGFSVRFGVADGAFRVIATNGPITITVEDSDVCDAAGIHSVFARMTDAIAEAIDPSGADDDIAR